MSIKDMEYYIMSKKAIIEKGEVIYPLWSVYYYQFLILKKLSIKKGNYKLNKLADILGEALVKANIDFLVDADEEKHNKCVKNIEEELVHSRKFS